MNPQVSVILNCYNSEKYVSQAIESVLNQSYANWELICFDNNSNDNTVNLIKSYNNTRVFIYINEVNENLSIARNKAISKANGDLIAFLDSDDIWLPQKLYEQVQIFKAKPNLGLVYNDAYYFRDEVEIHMQLYKYRKNYVGNCFDKLLVDYFLCISTCMVNKKSLISKQIEFDNILNVCEDLDYFLKISLFFEIGYVNQPLVKYRVHNNSMTYNQTKLFIIEREIIRNNLESDKFIVQSHKKSIEYFKYLNNIANFKYNWKIGNIKASREVLKKIKPIKFKSIVYFFLSYIPFVAIEKLFIKIKPNRIGY